jgi:hypothetical protein
MLTVGIASNQVAITPTCQRPHRLGVILDFGDDRSAQ